MSEKQTVKKQPGKHTKAKPNIEKETNPLTVLFEKMRPKSTPIEQRQKYMQQALDLMADRIPVLVNSPIQARTLELICKQGTKEQRQIVLEQLKPHLANLIQSKYSRFTAVELLNPKKTEEAESLIREIVIPNATKYMKNAISNISLNMIYNNCSRSQQNEIINQIVTRMNSSDKNYAIQQVKENPMIANIYLNNVQKPLQLAEGKMLLGSIVCIRVFLVLFHILFQLKENQNEEQYKTLYDFLAFLQNIESDQFNQLIDTPDGSELACYIFAMQPPKQKKLLINGIKPRIKEIFKTDKNASRFLTVATLQIDDIVLVKSTILELMAQNKDLFLSTNNWLYCFNTLLINQFERVIEKDGKCTCCVDDSLTNIIKLSQTLSQCKKSVIKRQYELCEQYIQIMGKHNLFDTQVIEKYAGDNKNCYFDIMREILSIEENDNVELQKQIEEIKKVQLNVRENLTKYISGKVHLLIQNTNIHFNYKRVIKLLTKDQKTSLIEQMKQYKPIDDRETKRQSFVLEWLE